MYMNVIIVEHGFGCPHGSEVGIIYPKVIPAGGFELPKIYSRTPLQYSARQ